MSASNIARTGKQRKRDRREGEARILMYAWTSKNADSHSRRKRKRGEKEKERENHLLFARISAHRYETFRNACRSVSTVCTTDFAIDLMRL